MPLTTMLRTKDHPVRRYFDGRFPNMAALRQRALIDSVRAERMTVAPPVVNGYPHAGVGAAFDFRLRYLIRATPLADLLPVGYGALGLSLAAGRGPTTPRALDEIRKRLNILLRDFIPGRPLANPDEEDALCRICYVLALYEQCYRFGVSPDSPLVRAGADATMNELLGNVNPSIMGDLRRLAQLAAESLPVVLTSQHANLNPTFSASALVGGADADLIVDGLLVDIKTVKDGAAAFTAGMRQLFGYALLDTYGDLGIGGVGLYFARHGVLARYELAEALAVAAGERISLGALRAELLTVLART